MGPIVPGDSALEAERGEGDMGGEGRGGVRDERSCEHDKRAEGERVGARGGEDAGTGAGEGEGSCGGGA